MDSATKRAGFIALLSTLAVTGALATVGIAQAGSITPTNCAIMLHSDPTDAWTNRC